MLQMIKKDFFINRKLVWFYLLYSLLFATVWNSGGSLIAITGFCTMMLISTTMSVEEKYKSNCLLQTLPIKRTHIVGAKYIVGIITYFIVLVIHSCFCYAVQFIPNQDYPFYEIVNIVTISFSSLVSALIIAAFIPLYYKWGYTKARFLFIIAIVFIMISSTGFLTFAMPFLINAATAVRVVLIYAASVLALFISYKISLMIYTNTDF